MNPAARILVAALAWSLVFAVAALGQKADPRPVSPVSVSQDARASDRPSIQVFGPGARWIAGTITHAARIAKEAAILEARLEQRAAVALTRAWVDVLRGTAKLLAVVSCPEPGPPGESSRLAPRPD